MSEALEPKDYMGRVIKAGCTIVYPVRTGANMWLQHMTVSHIEVIRAHVPAFKIFGTNSDGKYVKFESLERCVVVKEGDQNATV